MANRNTHIWDITKDDPPKPVIHDMSAWRASLKWFAGKRVVVTMRAEGQQRSLPQNAYLHAEPFKRVAEYTGESMERTKFVLMGECWGWEKSKVGGHDVPVRAHTSDMSVEEANYFIDWVIPWAAEFFGINEENGALNVEILMPNEADRLAWERQALEEREHVTDGRTTG